MNKAITLPVSELKTALPGLTRIIGRARTLPVLQSVRITRNPEGQIHLHATDLDSFVSFTMGVNHPGPATDLLVPLEHLAKAVKGTSPKDSITLTPESKDKARIQRPLAGSTMEQTITTLPPEEWPEVPKVKQPGVQLEPEFGKALKEALEMSSDDTSRYILNGACLDVSEKKFHYVVGTNGRALYSANSFCFTLQKSVIIPDSKFLSATDLMDEQPCFLSVEPGQEQQEAKDDQPAKEAVPGWVKLESPRWTFITREILGQFPNWKQVVPLPTAKWTVIELSEEAIKEIIQVIPNLPGADVTNFPIRLSADRHLVLAGRNRDEEEWTSVPVQTVNVHNRPVVTCLNRTYLMKAMRFGLNRIEIEDELSPILFSKGGRKMVIMPVRFEADKPQATPPEQTPSPNQTTEEPQQTPPPTPTEAKERTEMTKTTSRIPETTKTEPVETHHTNGNGSNGSAVKSVVEHIDKIKDTLKDVIRNLGEVTDALKQAEKEKRTTDREVEAIRAKLRQIQNVTI